MEPLEIKPTDQTRTITIPPAFSEKELEAMLDRAAERGARRALGDVGLEGDDAPTDIRELRSLLQAFRLAKKTIWQTVIRVITAAAILTLMTCLAVKFKS